MDTHMTDKGACCTSCIFFCGKSEQRKNRVGEYRNPGYSHLPHDFFSHDCTIFVCLRLPDKKNYMAVRFVPLVGGNDIKSMSARCVRYGALLWQFWLG